MYRWRHTANDCRTRPASAAEVRVRGVRIGKFAFGLNPHRLNLKRSFDKNSVQYCSVYLFNNVHSSQLDGCIVWNAHNTVLGVEALLIYIVPVCYVKQIGMERPSNIIISLHRKNFQLLRIFD